MIHPHNPNHPAGTCSNCGEEMKHNVPRLGAAGGFVHKATGRSECRAQHIIPPKGGWKERTWYHVEVAFTNTNPIHGALFYSGFLHDGNPAGYNTLVSHSYDDETYAFAHSRKVYEKVLFKREIHEVYFLRVLKELLSNSDDVPNRFKSVAEAAL